MIVRRLQTIILGIFVSSICFAGQNEIKIGELIVKTEVKLNKLLEGQIEKDRHEASGVLFLTKDVKHNL